MPRKVSLEQLEAREAKYAKRLAEANAEVGKLQEGYDEAAKAVADEKRKVRNHNLCRMGGMVYNRFGDDISPDEFWNMLDYIFMIDEVSRYIEEEKAKRQTVREEEIDKALAKTETETITMGAVEHKQKTLIDDNSEGDLNEG